MASVNKVFIVGNLGKDPEMRYLPSGEAVANINVATTDKWKDKTSGEQMEHTEWHRIVFFGRLAEVAAEYLKKGSAVYVEGSLQTKKWTDKNQVERYTTQIKAHNLQMLGPKPAGGNQQDREPEPRSEPRGEPQPPAKKPAGKFDDMEDDIPF